MVVTAPRREGAESAALHRVGAGEESKLLFSQKNARASSRLVQAGIARREKAEAARLAELPNSEAISFEKGQSQDRQQTNVRIEEETTPETYHEDQELLVDELASENESQKLAQGTKPECEQRLGFSTTPEASNPILVPKRLGEQRQQRQHAEDPHKSKLWEENAPPGESVQQNELHEVVLDNAEAANHHISAHKVSVTPL